MPSLLDTQLVWEAAAMKKVSVLAILICLILLLSIVSPVYAAGNNKVMKEVKYSDNTSIFKRLVWVAQKIPGVSMLVTKDVITSDIQVEIDGMVVATIPVDSKLNGMSVHQECLDYQYGTDDWYTCEVALQ